MKKLLLTTLFVFAVLSVSAQKMIDIYKKGTVKLVPDPGYAQGDNWDIVFRTYFDTINGKSTGKWKSLIVMSDGSVIVNHNYTDYYTLFSPDGRFEKEFGIKNGKAVGSKNLKSIQGVLDARILFTGLDNMGNMTCSDLNGNYLKTLKLDYMGRQFVALPDNKIAVVGWAIWKNKFRDFVSIVDYETNKETIVWETFTDRADYPGTEKLFSYYYKIKGKGGIGFNTMPFDNSSGTRPVISCTGRNLVVAVPATGEIFVYNLEGKLISSGRTVWEKNYISVEEQKEIQKKAIEKFKKMAVDSLLAPFDEKKQAFETITKRMEADLSKISEPIPLPAISTIIPDSDGNLLFFEYPEEGSANKFNVWIYSNGGTFVCQSSFVCDDYDLVINPAKMVFHNGYIYALQTLKKSEGVPLRLVRFRVTGL